MDHPHDHRDEYRCRFLAGVVRDATRLRYAMAAVDIVIYAAVIWYVGIVEVIPVETAETNLLSTSM